MTRTTLTLEDDVADRLKEEMSTSGRSFKETVNNLIRLGLEAKKQPEPPRKFVVRARPLEARPGISFDNIEELLEQVEESRY